jgi:hypothetical protein
VKAIKTALIAGMGLFAVSGQGIAATVVTYLSFNSLNNVISGYSATDVGYSDDTAYCIDYDWIQNPLNPEEAILACSRAALIHYSAAVTGYLYGPTGLVYSGASQYGGSSAAVFYSESNPQIGSWSANAEHSAISDTYHCNMIWYGYTYTIDYGSCDYVWSDPPVYIGSSYSQATSSCIHHGTPQTGSLTGAELYAEFGTGYVQYSVNRWSCKMWLHTKIDDVVANWTYAHSFKLVGLGRHSLQHGGNTGDGASHWNGLDADFRYVRSDGSGAGYDFAGKSPPYAGYDQAATNDLIQAFCNKGATMVGVDSRAGITASCRQHWSGHSDHFHVRFSDPDGLSN